MKDLKFYKTAGGKIVVALSAPNADAEGMKELAANTTDAAFEKHVPAVEVGEKVLVKVGEVAHPMIEVHYIEFVALVSEERGLEVKFLFVLRADKHIGDEAPEASFAKVEHGVAYAYCNLHGLWKKEF